MQPSQAVDTNSWVLNSTGIVMVCTYFEHFKLLCIGIIVIHKVCIEMSQLHEIVNYEHAACLHLRVILYHLKSCAIFTYCYFVLFETRLAGVSFLSSFFFG